MRRLRYYITVLSLIIPFVFLSGCLEFKSIDQPSSILLGETLIVSIEVAVQYDSIEEIPNMGPYFGICLPEGWIIIDNDLKCTGVYNEIIVYDPNLSLEQETLSPSPDGYYWWVGVGKAVVAEAGSVNVEIKIQTDNQTGRFYIDYMLGTTDKALGELNYDRSNNHLIDIVDEYTPRESTVFVERNSVVLSWTAPFTNEGLKGYNIYRNGQLINKNLLTDTEFIDEIASDGIYFYEISSVYDNDNEYLTPYKMRAIVFLGFPRGTGEPHDPFQVSTAIQLFSIADDPNLLDKSFILINDIDLDPNLPNRMVFERAVIAPDINDTEDNFQGMYFTGIFDGNGHKIFNLTINGHGHLGLFGQLASGAEVKNLGVIDVNISGVGDYVGGLAGSNHGYVTACYSTGKINGSGNVGGLIGYNSGRITMSYSSVDVVGGGNVGGLVGYNELLNGIINYTYSTGKVSGIRYVGGLVGRNLWGVINSYSTSLVLGTDTTGGLIGSSRHEDAFVGSPGYAVRSFWNIETSGQTTSAGGTGKMTFELQDIQTYQDAGWDFYGQSEDGLHEVWHIEERSYPVLAILSGYIPPQLQGKGTSDDPYLVTDKFRLGAMIYYRRDAHYRLTNTIDLTGIFWGRAVIPHFEGTFDGNNLTISNLIIEGIDYLGLFGQLEAGAEVTNLNIVDVNIVSWDRYVGALAGSNNGNVYNCHSTGLVTGYSYIGGLAGANWKGTIRVCNSSSIVTGDSRVGGLVGDNSGSITASHSTSTVNGFLHVGGLVGDNRGCTSTSYSTGAVKGNNYVGGLVAENQGSIANSFSISSVSGDQYIGGFVGSNTSDDIILASYSTGTVNGIQDVGGFIGTNKGIVSNCFWDIETSGQISSSGGIGLTTTEMQDINTFISEGWDFAGEVLDGTCDYWQFSSGDYPKLFYDTNNSPIILEGLGTIEQPYLIRDEHDLGTVWFEPLAHYRLEESMNLSGITWSMAVVPWFGGTFDGNSNILTNMHIKGDDNLGLFGQLTSGSNVYNLGLEAVDVNGTGDYVGALVGYNRGSITKCYNSGTISGSYRVGGLVGMNDIGGEIATSYSKSSINGNDIVGGLVGQNIGDISTSYSSGISQGINSVGGFVGYNNGKITMSYSGNMVEGDAEVGGFVGRNGTFSGSKGSVIYCYSTGAVSGNVFTGGLIGRNWEDNTSIISSFWDMETSGETTSDWGTAKATDEMQTAATFLEAGWDFVDETENGTEDIWWIDEGNDYPRLWWELIPEN